MDSLERRRAGACPREHAIEAALAALGYRMEHSLDALDEQGHAIVEVATGELADTDDLPGPVLALAEEWSLLQDVVTLH